MQTKILVFLIDMCILVKTDLIYVLHMISIENLKHALLYDPENHVYLLWYFLKKGACDAKTS